MALDPSGTGQWFPVLPDQPRIPGCFCGEGEPNGENVCTEITIVRVGEGTAFSLTAMRSRDGAAVAVGYNGEIETSDDGASWTPQTSGTGEALYGVAFGAGEWVAVGDAGTVVTSTNRTDWTDRSPVGTEQFVGVEYGSGLFVAVADDGKIYSSPDGVTWTLRHDFSGEFPSSIAFGGGQFVVVGASGFIANSPNGIAWTTQTSGTALDLFQVAFQNNTFAAFVFHSLNVLLSTNGVTWTLAAVPATDSGSRLRALGGGGGVFLVSTDANENWISTDGENWTRQLPDTASTVDVVEYYGGCQFNANMPYPS